MFVTRRFLKRCFAILLGIVILLLSISFYFFLKVDHSLDSITSLTPTYLFLSIHETKIENCSDFGVVETSTYQEPLQFLKSYLQKDISLKNERTINTLALALQHQKIGCAIIEKQSYEELSGNHYLKQAAVLLYEHTASEDKTISPLFSQTVHILLSGIDSLGSAKINTRSDMNMLVSLNLTRKEILLTSIPRDAYIQNACLNQHYDKLTHTSNQGIHCTVSSLEQLLSISIPYYVRFSFSSVIEGINLLDGLEIEVPMDFCEYNEYKQVIYLKKGKQTLNGSQVLALARHRYTLIDGDMARNKNQQRILSALINKTMNLKTLFIVEDILKLIAKTVDTSFTKEELYALIQLQANDNRPFTIRHQSIQGEGNMRYSASIPSVLVSVLELSPVLLPTLESS